ncbi:hypothetical protein [Pseudonocardia sp.]|uniref:hypothetical protein n=1 Tax=Pseudonocardia sp. TaxID=60912 RepID=UPI0031FC2311
MRRPGGGIAALIRFRVRIATSRIRFPSRPAPALRSPRDVFPLETALTQELVHGTNAAPGAAEPVVIAVAVVGVLRADHGPHPGRHPRAAQLPDRLDLLAHGIADYAPDGVAGIDAAAS